MSEYLCIALQGLSDGDDLHSLEWSLLDAAAQKIASGQDPLETIVSQLPETLEGRKIIAIAPANRTLLTAVDVPDKQIRHLKNALPYMVEDQLIDAIEDIHLATPALTKGGHIPLAAIRKDEMSSWLEYLEEHGVIPDFMFLDVLCVPQQENCWSLLFDKEYVLLRLGEHSGVSLPVLALENSIQLVIADILSNDEAELPRIDIITPTDETEAENTDDDDSDSDVEASVKSTHNDIEAKLEQFIRSENLETNKQHYEESSFEILSVTAVKHLHSGLNLLQGGFRSSNATNSSLQGAKKLVGGIAAAIAVFSLINIAGGFYFNYRASTLTTENIAIYRDIFPKQRRITDPKKELNSKLSRVEGGGSRFLSLLDASTSQMVALGEANSVHLKQLRYDSQRSQVMLELEVADIQALDNYKQALSSQGLAVDILSANKSESSVNGRIQIGEL